MKIIFLGTNGWYDTQTGNTICTLIETEDYFIILDAGNGFHKIDQYIGNSTKAIYLFISHFHLDHIVGLHILNKFNFSQGIRIFGQPGTVDTLDKIINAPFTIPMSGLPYKVTVHELSEGRHDLPFIVECRFMRHASICMGYRFEIDGKIITYCPDTGICENAVELSRNSDLVISECSFRSGQHNEQWPHLNPEEAAQIAKEANAGKLALLHFDANIYRILQQRQSALEIAREQFCNTIAAVDNMQIEL